MVVTTDENASSAAPGKAPPAVAGGASDAGPTSPDCGGAAGESAATGGFAAPDAADAVPAHPASPELFAAVGALWHLSQLHFDADTGAATPPPVWPMALQAAVADPLGDADTADPDSIDAAVLVPLALPLLKCSMQRLQRKAAAVIRKAVCATDVTCAISLTATEEFLGSACRIIEAPVAAATSPSTAVAILKDILWAVENTAAGNTAATTAVVQCPGLLPACAAMLTAGRENVTDAMLMHALGALANVAGENAEFRDHILDLDVLDPAVALLDDAARDASSVTHPAAALLSKCFRSKPHPPGARVKAAVPALVRALGHAEDNVASEAAWAISHYTDYKDTERDHFIGLDGAVTRTFAAMQRSDDLLTPCLRVAGNLCSGTAAHTRAATEQGLMQAMPFLLTHAKRNVAKEAAWTLSNILADDPKYISLMLHYGVLPHVLRQLQTGPFEVRKEAVWCVCNAACDASDVDIQGMLAAGVVPALAAVLVLHDAKVLGVALEALENLLEKAEDDTKAAVHATPGMLDAIEALQNHANTGVYDRATAILESYFDANGEDEHGEEGGHDAGQQARLPASGGFNFA